MDVRAGSPGTPAAQARARWQATADRLWPIAMADPDGYRRVADLVGLVLAELRRRTATVDELLALDADPRTVLGVVPDGAAAGVGGPRVLLDAACAIRGDELHAAGARAARIGAIAAARQAGEAWVLLEDGPTRSVEMHLVTGLALVASADPYAGPKPYQLGETILDAATGDPVTGPAGRDVSFAGRAQWLAERERWRTEIAARLDVDPSDGLR